ncbi:acyltransferase [Frankia sp. QA3]|uniref:acyltransferase family protein n=1 Tax=Frankia sp. QA3 TaxID=710111 RepID=UPI000269C368|nr:acyltransferase [Frankia sp. QA3]EIV93323.1 putative acyltransferase [Frankia sp. QA3]
MESGIGPAGNATPAPATPPQDGSRTPAATPSAGPAARLARATLAAAYAGPNSMGALRLLFAGTVLLSHGWALSGHTSPALGRHEFDAVAVNGFFAVSGFLVTRSAVRLSVPRFLWHRALRILPAFWACLALVALVVAPLAWLHDNGSLGGYPLTGPHGALRYLTDNALVRMSFYDIGGTPSGTFYPAPGSGMPLAWDGSLWTLWWEVLCYLGIAALAAVGLLRRRPVLAVGAALLLLAAIHPLGPGGALFPAPFSPDMARFGLHFLAGAVLCLYAERLPLSGRLASMAAVVFAASFLITDQHLLSALPMAYLCVWLAVRLPLHRVGARHDLSYGLYIYGFPIQQLATVYGLHRLGAVAYMPLTTTVTVLLAAASWFAVEAPALRHKNPRSAGRARAATTAPRPAPRGYPGRADGGWARWHPAPSQPAHVPLKAHPQKPNVLVTRHSTQSQHQTRD